MDKLEEFQKASVARMQGLLKYLKLHWKGVTIIGLVIVFCVLLTLVIIPNIQHKIRTNEISALIKDDFKNVKQVTFIDYDQLEATIRKENHLSVVLVDINDENYAAFEKAINDETVMSQYQGNLYLYPLIYDIEKTKKFYHLDNGITLLYFENQAEKERTELTLKKEIDLYLVDHLNSLTNASEIEKQAEQVRKEAEAKKKADLEAESTDETEETVTSSSEEIIDELL